MSEIRKKLKHQYKKLYSDIEAILFEHDFMGINFGDNPDEYDPEVDTILPRLKDAKDVADVTLIIHEEFSRWFDKDMAGSKDHPAYKAMAEDVWAVWLKHTRPLSTESLDKEKNS